MFVAGCAALLIVGMPQAARSAQSFKCLQGADSVIRNVCGARWEAANIRAHVAAGKNGGLPPACLAKTAQLLDEAAAVWLASNTYVKLTRWPCGDHPAVAHADDGVLDNACPNTAWSYNNRGAVSCRLRKPSPYLNEQDVKAATDTPDGHGAATDTPRTVITQAPVTSSAPPQVVAQASRSAVNDDLPELYGLLNAVLSRTNQKGETVQYYNKFAVHDCKFLYEQDAKASWGEDISFRATGALLNLKVTPYHEPFPDRSLSPTMYGVMLTTADNQYSIQFTGCPKWGVLDYSGCRGSTTPSIPLLVGSDALKRDAAIRELKRAIDHCTGF